MMAGLGIVTTHVCGECGSFLVFPQGKFIRCFKDASHTTIKPKKRTRTLYNGQTKQMEEFDIMSQQSVTTEKGAAIIAYETPGGSLELSGNMVRSLFCPEATEAEAYSFIQFCKYHQLNPFLREAHLVKYSARNPASFVVGYRTFIQRAEKMPEYDGFEAGLIIQTNDGPQRMRGAFHSDDQVLLGGWCEVYRKDRTRPSFIEVSLGEYVQKTTEGSPNRFWREKPGTMIRKVAVSQAHQDAFPDLLPGASIGGPEDDGVVIEGEARMVDYDAYQEGPTIPVMPLPDDGPNISNEPVNVAPPIEPPTAPKPDPKPHRKASATVGASQPPDAEAGEALQRELDGLTNE